MFTRNPCVIRVVYTYANQKKKKGNNNYNDIIYIIIITY